MVDADLVLIAIGFEHPEHEGLVGDLALDLDHRGNIRTERTYKTSHAGVFACGDARIGQSLVVTAIAEGRKCARVVNKALGGTPMDQDRELLAIGAWSGESDSTLRHEAEAAGPCVPVNNSSQDRVRVLNRSGCGPAQRAGWGLLGGGSRICGIGLKGSELGWDTLAQSVRELRPHFPGQLGSPDGSGPPSTLFQLWSSSRNRRRSDGSRVTIESGHANLLSTQPPAAELHDLRARAELRGATRRVLGRAQVESAA